MSVPVTLEVVWIAAVIAVVTGLGSPPAVKIALSVAVGLLAALHVSRHRIGTRAARVLADVALLTPLTVWPT